ncbi:MAG: hypothetical protein HOM11_09380 [Methylococcales bacterium]|jgi:hypothetical protein|nr:hypothetical protein [Methylococcales bacterium]MBT7444091.1 hypothetical protein [Methylococcales bacterium]
MIKNSISAVVFLATTLIVSACSPIGPNGMRYNRQDYNLALQQTNDEQLLLNLVRLRYRDTPQFIEVSSISSTFNLTLNSSVAATIKQNFSEVYNLGFSHSYAEKPTISYSPLSGEQFIQRMLSPITLDKILLLNRSGWSSERLFRVAIQRINQVKNALSASGPTPNYLPEYQRFVAASKALRALQKAGAVNLHLTGPSQQNFVVNMQDIPARQTFNSNLGLPDKTTHTFSTAPQTNAVHIETRSFLGVLYYLSHAVDIPQAHQDLGIVTITKDHKGEVFDWRQVTQGVLNIKSSLEPPEHASTAIQYRGYWFYIDDADLNAKSTFSLLMQLYSLQAGNIKSSAPVLTLPVGG